MFGSVILEVGIGLVLIFFLVSMLCTAVNEWIARLLALRAKNLEFGIQRLLNDDEWMRKFYNHPLVNGVSKEGWWERQISRITDSKDTKAKKIVGAGAKHGPSNISPQTFATVVLGLLKEADSDGRTEGEGSGSERNAPEMGEILAKGIATIGENSDLKRVLQTFLDLARAELGQEKSIVTAFRVSLEKWFDDSTDRISGWYKRKSQLIILCMAVIICSVLNIDTFVIVNGLYQDTNLRESLVTMAEARVQQSMPDNDEPAQNATEIKEELAGMGLPIGWSGDTGNPRSLPVHPTDWFMKVLGVLFSAFAVALGAPFWFDLLNRVVNLRNSGKTPEKTPTILTAAAENKQ